MRHSAIARTLATLVCALLVALAPLPAFAAVRDGATLDSERLLEQADAAMRQLHWADAAALLKKLIASEPSWRAYQKLGHAQFNLAQYQDAISSFTSAVALAKAAPDDSATRLAIAQMLTEQGNVYLKLRDVDSAMVSYQAALPFSEKYPVAYFNVCALDYTQGRIETALADCNAAIKADPDNADAYFIKGALLFANTTMNADEKMVAPPEALDALNMYLKLAPDGSHAQDVHYMLDSLK